MKKTNFDTIHRCILDIEARVQNLADALTHEDELDPDFTLVEIAKIYSSLLNISAKVYVKRPDLVPEHLRDCNWEKYTPQ